MITTIDLSTGKIETRPLTPEEIAALPLPEPEPIPQIVTRFQALAALHLKGKLTQVESIMNSPETPVLTKLAWDNALSFERSSSTLATLASILELSEQELDELFIIASGLTA